MPTSPYSDATAASIYARITAPAQFAAPARDLVEMVKSSAGMTALDVGTGTGVVAECILRAVGGKPAWLVGVDGSPEMLRVGRQQPSFPMVAGRVPNLPFRDECFDVVTAGFVISHVASYADSLLEILRVCRTGARFGMSAWGSLPNAAGQLWTEIASRFVPRRELDNAFRAQIPWDGWFADRRNIERALTGAGFESVRADTRTYRTRMPVQDFLTSREASMQGAILRERLTTERWTAFESEVVSAFHQQFGEAVEYERDVNFGIGVKP